MEKGSHAQVFAILVECCLFSPSLELGQILIVCKAGERQMFWIGEVVSLL